ncbi:gamma-glutamyltransferase, partial [Pantoea agglomerans]|nr:gamma-glutamyltransferase [Pantoea agglomerans]
KNHRADWVTLLSRPFAGGSVQELPPNGQGIATLIALGILDRYVTDEDHLEFPAEHLLSNDYIRQRAALIDPDKAGDFR